MSWLAAGDSRPFRDVRRARASKGGSEEALAKKMLERALQKAEERAVCGK